MNAYIAKHDPTWTKKFENEAEVIRMALGPVASSVHHIGSTSIPEIYAKPIIDILIEVSSIDALDERSMLLEQENYEALGEFGISGRRYFRKDNPAGVREYHVHAFAEGSSEVARHLAFRDYLRSHTAVAKEYSELKIELAERYPSDIEAYINGKNPYIKLTQNLALAWLHST